jgi:hypothetical protein
MLAALVWITLLTSGLLCYPRRPRTAGLLFVLLAVWTWLLRFLSWGDGRTSTGTWGASWVAAIWLAMGLFWLVKFSNATARAEHVGYWTAKN